MPEVKLSFDDNNLTRLLYGDLNKNLTTIEKSIGVSIKTRGNDLSIEGMAYEVDVAKAVI
jgi:phosphate starvation-inducible protein PhoH